MKDIKRLSRQVIDPKLIVELLQSFILRKAT